jgi:hypothetical protein
MWISLSSKRLATLALTKSHYPSSILRQLSQTAAKEESATAASATTAAARPKGWWHSAEFWGGLGALAGWGMSGAAIYDAFQKGPEVISLTMTPVLIIYSTLFARWAWVVKPQNLALCACHVSNVVAQSNQMRRALEYKLKMGQEAEVMELGQSVGLAGVGLVGAIGAAPTVRAYLTRMNWGYISSIAAADAGPFTVHFWAPMSKWFISGASFLDLHRPTDKISLAQYTALTATGCFFSRYALLVTPINYNLCAVNIALFSSSAWHLGRKIKADYVDTKKPELSEEK